MKNNFPILFLENETKLSFTWNQNEIYYQKVEAPYELSVVVTFIKVSYEM